MTAFVPFVQKCLDGRVYTCLALVVALGGVDVYACDKTEAQSIINEIVGKGSQSVKIAALQFGTHGKEIGLECLKRNVTQ